MNGIDNCYIINLDKDVERLKNTTREVEDKIGIKPIRIQGVYGKDLTKQEMKDNCSYIYSKIGNKSAIGCAMSHIKAWKQMIKSGDNSSLFLEDDVIIDDDFYDKFNNIYSTIPKDYGIIYLGCLGGCSINKKYDTSYSILKLINGKYHKKVIKINDNVFVPAFPLALHGYILSREGAIHLLKNIEKDKIKFHIDYQILQYINDIKSYTIKPQLIKQTNVDTNTSNNINTKYPILINNVLRWKDSFDIPFDYKMTIGHYQIGDYIVNVYTYIAILLGIVGGIKDVKSSTIILLLLAYNIPEWILTNFKTFKDSVINSGIIIFFYLLTTIIISMTTFLLPK